jgi:hypothetical protein
MDLGAKIHGAEMCYLGAKIHGAEMCYLGAMIHGAEVSVFVRFFRKNVKKKTKSRSSCWCWRAAASASGSRVACRFLPLVRPLSILFLMK